MQMNDDEAQAEATWNQFYKAAAEQGCQMVCFQTKNPNLGKFWRALE
jgi:hypothetical protein